MAEKWYEKAEREAVERVLAEMKKPQAEDRDALGGVDKFNPWEIFPALYGSYSSDFDKCAVDVLIELRDREKRREDLGAEMFREILCTQHLCDYGTSPRVCFPSLRFKGVLPDLIVKWIEFGNIMWGASDWRADD